MIKKVFSIWMLLLGCMSALAQGKEDALQVFFPVGSATLNANAIPQSVVDSAVAACSRGEKYAVMGVASPEGSYSSNVRLATKRADAIIRHLVQRTGMPDSMFVAQTKVADIAMLRSLVAQDDQLPEKARVMEVLNTDASTGAVLSKLKQLGDGTPYLYIKDRLFPFLRASVKPDKTEAGYHPDLAGVNQPKVVHRDYQAYRAGTLRQGAEQNRQNAVATEKSRHSSSINGQEVVKNEVTDSTKADSVKRDSLITGLQTPNVKADEKIESTEKSAGSDFLYWLIIAALVLALLALAYYYQQKVKNLKAQLASKEHDLFVNEQKLKKAEDQLNNQKVEKVVEKVDVYNDGKYLYDYLQNGGLVSKWTNEQIETLISYYKLQNYELIQNLETEYDNLPLNHILFEVLVDMGKTDAEIQRMMNISQSTIRSYRFRIKNKKR